MFYRPGSKTGAIGSQFYKRCSARLVVTQVGEEHCDVPATQLPALLKLRAPGQNRFAAGAAEELRYWELDRVRSGASPAFPKRRVHINQQLLCVPKTSCVLIA